MALATGTIIALATAAASAGLTAYNTNKTAKRQDRALADDIRNQGLKRREGEVRTNAEIEKLKLSTNADERAKKLQAYTDALRGKKNEITNGLVTGIGGETFQQDAATAAGGAVDYGMENADTMSRIDAPIDQRVGEGVSFGNLGIDMNTIAREAQGRHFLDQLRLKGIVRNPWIDAGADVLGAVGGSMSGMGEIPDPTQGQMAKVVGSGQKILSAPKGLDAYTNAFRNYA
jgi:hypothetical protein